MKRPARHLRCRDHGGGDERAGKLIADSDPALRPEHGWREHQPDAERGAKQKIPRRGHPLKHWPQHLCRRRAVTQRAVIFAAALHRVARPERAPERLVPAR